MSTQIKTEGPYSKVPEFIGRKKHHSKEQLRKAGSKRKNIKKRK